MKRLKVQLPSVSIHIYIYIYIYIESIMHLRCCSRSWFVIYMILFASAVGVSIWNIFLAVRGLSEFSDLPVIYPCFQILETFFIGTIVASALVILVYGFLVGSVYILIWALLGQMWVLNVRERCPLAPTDILGIADTSLIILWYDLATFVASAILVCFSCCFALPLSQNYP